ncbi:putative receptor-like protein kinase At3g47110 [Eucalyptus grandis]|uniref:putative receptor-like protein kinase At3g47110 n=1 Tax=Eucalyptus grandis TaxID=71139 RepID=UPI00192EF61B|nr:putative receptor-like protein kinase At3g47110 [Eucalyptus grandis]
MIEDPQGIMGSWNESIGHCNWPGVSCSRRHVGRVIALDLEDQKLVGTILANIGNLTFLMRIDLGLNWLRGHITEDFGKLFRLKTLILSNNELKGEIPGNLSSCVVLQYLDLHYNQLVGRIPGELRYLIERELTHFWFSKNDLTGGIPIWLGNGSSLVELRLADNDPRGQIPAELGSIPKLEVLELGSNNLTGGIPSSIYNLTSLVYLDVFYRKCACQSRKVEESYAGNIPPEIENLNGLQFLAIYYNDISGEIPQGIGKVQNLTSIILWGNRISGTIPSSLGNATQLLHLELQYNQLEGDIPPSLGWCQQLQLLRLSDNNLNGTIPKEVINLSSLSINFDVARNSLTGPLPLEVGNMSQIVHLDLSDNKLIREIPSTLSQCVMLIFLSLEGNLFEGSIPASLRTLIGLEYLNLSRNRLSGKIPIYFEKFTVLKALNLSFNSLEGEVPQAGIFRDTKHISIIGNKGLCGGIQELRLPACKVCHTKKRRKLPKLKVSITVTVSFFIVLTCFIVVVYWRRKPATRPSAALPTDECFQKVSYAKLRQATNEFSPSNLIGQGSHGSVYRGILDGNQLVAVKVLNLRQKGAFKSFLAECESLRNIRHRNLVNIITVCSSIDFTGAEFKALIYDLMQNGSLEQWLHPSENQSDMPKLSFSQRLDIAIDVASAIEYLHHHCQMSIVHGDLKPSNVLLDHDMLARVCDFGLARFLCKSTNLDASHCQASSSGLKGTVGYIAPEYGLNGASSLLGDVYSFGILLLEMFTGIRPTDVMFKDGWTLHEFVKTTLLEGTLKMLDPSLLSSEHLVAIDGSQIGDVEKVRFEEGVAAIMRIGVLCSEEIPVERMDMANALSELLAVKEKFLRHSV